MSPLQQEIVRKIDSGLILKQGVNGPYLKDPVRGFCFNVRKPTVEALLRGGIIRQVTTGEDAPNEYALTIRGMEEAICLRSAAPHKKGEGREEL